MSDAAALIALLDGFHITDRALLRARDRARDSGDDGSVRALRKEMRRYFDGIAAESDAQLVALDRKLDDLYQRQFNLQAERGVVVRRLDGARKVLAAMPPENGGAP